MTAQDRPVAVCVKWVDLHPVVDHLHGTVTPSARGGGFSPADRAALEVAIRFAQSWDTQVVLVCAGPAEAEQGLLHLGASGADRIVRIDQSPGLPGEIVGEVLAPVLGPADLDAHTVICGDLSYDRGSGAVPALLAHHLQHAQALGLIEVAPGEPGYSRAVRRLDGARRELLEIKGPSVLSVEGSAATLRRAPLHAARQGTTSVDVRRGRIETHVEPPRMRPWRPRARVLAGPQAPDAFDRIVSLTGALVDHAPPRTLKVDPAEAAQLMLAQLRAWGYLEQDLDEA
jgi:electron transfer flavoprotein beta subunit